MGRPIVAITMGDAAGIGPEIIVKALADAELRSKARMLVVGDLRRLQLAGDIVASPLTLRKVAEPSEALFEEGTIDVLDIDCIPEDLAWGELSAAAGHGSFLFIEKAVALAMDRQVDAICTGPLNKAALHAAGHKYPGHTELLAELTGTEEVSMMLTAPKMRVIHVTTHIGLIDAIAKINGDLVYRTIKRGYELLRASGIENPRIAVCAITRTLARTGCSATAKRRKRSSRASRRPRLTVSTPSARSRPTPCSSLPAAATSTWWWPSTMTRATARPSTSRARTSPTMSPYLRHCGRQWTWRRRAKRISRRT
jgi:hypothetical protein